MSIKSVQRTRLRRVADLTRWREMRTLSITVVLVAGSCLLGCGHKEDSTVLPGAKAVRNGEYSLQVQNLGSDTYVAVTRGDRLLWYMNAYQDGLVDQTMCITTNRDVFFKDDYRHVGHGSFLYEIVNKDGIVEVLRDQNEDGVWDGKEIRERPRSKWYVNVGGEWQLKPLDTNTPPRQPDGGPNSRSAGARGLP